MIDHDEALEKSIDIITDGLTTNTKDRMIYGLYRYFLADKMAGRFDDDMSMEKLHLHHRKMLAAGRVVHHMVRRKIAEEQREESREKTQSCQRKRLQAHKQFVDNKSTSQA